MNRWAWALFISGDEALDLWCVCVRNMGSLFFETGFLHGLELPSSA